MLFLLFFFFKQKTAYEMRISDWSSDVCSSDLVFTEIGESYYSHITTGMIELASATAQVLHKDNVRYLRLWSVPGFAAQWLSEQLANFERQWPELTIRSEEQTSELQSLMRISYAVFCLKTKTLIETKNQI